MTTPEQHRAYICHLAAIAVALAFLAVVVMLAAARGQASASTRPVWNGRSPAVWTSDTPPMCVAADLGRHGWFRINDQGREWRGECQRDGREFAWGVAAP